MAGASFFHSGRHGTAFLAVLFLCLIFSYRVSYAHCVTCATGDCDLTRVIIVDDHAKGRQELVGNISAPYDGILGVVIRRHQAWWRDNLFEGVLLPAMMKMTEQLSAIGLYQMLMIGTQFDAKEQLETQRDLQILQARAHKDYHPSEEFCAFGSNTRSLAASYSKGRFNTQALGQIALDRHLGTNNTASAYGTGDRRFRWEQYVSTYCNEQDNGWKYEDIGTSAGNGLTDVCQLTSPDERNRFNIDIDYARQIEEPRTIEADFTDTVLPPNGKEEDLIALQRNLYGNSVLSRNHSNLDISNSQARREAELKYFNLRSIAAKRGVAEHSFNSIVGLKTRGSKKDEGERKDTRETMGAILKQLGMPEDEIPRYMGEEEPSYYAQLEILAKKIYQDPGFFSGLYDKPVNVERRKVAIRAIELMLERAMYESRLRQEMLSSVLLSAKLRKWEKDVQSRITSLEKEETR